jgi:hypothetical protein
LILYRDWFDSKDVLYVSVAIHQISLMKENVRKKKPKTKVIRVKRPASKPAKRRPLTFQPAAWER